MAPKGGSDRIPGFEGLWASGDTQDAVQQELPSVLEDWVLLGLRLGHRMPVADGFDLNVLSVGLMPAFGPVSRDDLVRGLRDLGFAGPFVGGRHGRMIRGTCKAPGPIPTEETSADGVPGRSD